GHRQEPPGSGGDLSYLECGLWARLQSHPNAPQGWVATRGHSRQSERLLRGYPGELNGGFHTLYRQQELLVLVATGLADGEGIGNRLRGDPDPVAPAQYQGRGVAPLALGPCAGPRPRQPLRLGKHGDRRVSRRAVSRRQSLAPEPSRARRRTLRQHGDARGLLGASQSLPDERALELSQP